MDSDGIIIADETGGIIAQIDEMLHTKLRLSRRLIGRSPSLIDVAGTQHP